MSSNPITELRIALNDPDKKRLINNTADFIRVANAIACLVLAVIFVFHPGVISLILCGIPLYAGYEIHMITQNVKELCNASMITTLWNTFTKSDRAFSDKLTANAPVAHWLMDTALAINARQDIY